MNYAERETSMVSTLCAAPFPLAIEPAVLPDAPLPCATLSDVTEAVLNILRPDLERCDRQLVVEIAEPSEVVDGDPSAVAQVLADLLESVSRGALTNRVRARVAMERGDVVITACEDGPGSGMALARELTDRYGMAISCCVAAASRSTEIVVRVRVAESPA